LLYGYDKGNARIVAMDKASGAFKEQYRVTLDPGWKDLRGLYILPGASGDPATVYWIDGKRLYNSVLKPIPQPPGAVPGSSARPSGRSSPAATRRPATTPSVASSSVP
jgi:hypothetical protein